MHPKKEMLLIKWGPNALTTVQWGPNALTTVQPQHRLSHQPLSALKSFKEAPPPVFSKIACCVVGNLFTTWGLLPRKYGIPIIIPMTTVFTNVRFMLCSQFQASLYKQYLSVLMPKQRIIFTHFERSIMKQKGEKQWPRLSTCGPDHHYNCTWPMVTGKMPPILRPTPTLE